MTTLTKAERALYDLDGPGPSQKPIFDDPLDEIAYLKAALSEMNRDNGRAEGQIGAYKQMLADAQTQINELTGEARAWEKSAKLAWAEVERQIEKRFGG